MLRGPARTKTPLRVTARPSSLAADRAMRVARHAKVAPAHRLCVEQQQTSGERCADSRDELQRLSCLHGPDNAGQRREHSHDRATRLLELLALAEQAVVA